MRLYKGSFKLEQPMVLEDGEQRERALRKDRILDLSWAVAMTAIGIAVLLNNIYGPFHSILQVIGGVLIAVFFIVSLSFTFPLMKYDLKPTDEYESALSNKSKAGAFEFLSLAVFFLIVFGREWDFPVFLGLLIIILGISRFIARSKDAR